MKRRKNWNLIKYKRQFALHAQTKRTHRFICNVFSVCRGASLCLSVTDLNPSLTHTSLSLSLSLRFSLFPHTLSQSLFFFFLTTLLLLNSRSQRKVFALKGKRPREVHVKLGERSGGLNDGNGSLAFLISGDWSVPLQLYLLFLYPLLFLDVTSCSFYPSLMLIVSHFCQKRVSLGF